MAVPRAIRDTNASSTVPICLIGGDSESGNAPRRSRASVRPSPRVPTTSELPAAEPQSKWPPEGARTAQQNLLADSSAECRIKSGIPSMGLKR